MIENTILDGLEACYEMSLFMGESPLSAANNLFWLVTEMYPGESEENIHGLVETIISINELR